ncbi:hypothetical protein V5O48_018930 [Marasmius crinis-equi]|uniref:AB hydrolase-1 domain-containing protein n=1 Tax=Marasmius crinis-equi TaxID=585013 RepID=A0ABR3EJZ7_9AGAR
MVLTEKTYSIADDVRFFFTDSGAPPDSKGYTTLVAIHGLGFTGAIFEKLQSQAQTHNLRIVALNRRDYPGSTPFSDVELEDLKSGDEARARRVFDSAGLHIALFLRKLIEEEGIPLPSEEAGRRGGIAVMGWSLGALTAMLPFAVPKSVLGEATYGLLERYVRGLIILDPPYSALGYPDPSYIKVEKMYNAFTDPTANGLEGVWDKFVHLASSRYQYDTVRDGVPITESIEKTGLLSRTDQCLADSWSREELERLSTAGAIVRGDFAMHGCTGILNKITRQVLVAPESRAATFFPRLSITYLYATQSIWTTIVGYIETRKLYQEHKETIRTINFVELKGSDHFVHYNNPEYFLKITKEILT